MEGTRLEMVSIFILLVTKSPVAVAVPKVSIRQNYDGCGSPSTPSISSAAMMYPERNTAKNWFVMNFELYTQEKSST